MKSEWSKSWKSSRKARKQKKYRANAPKHVRNKMMKAPLSDELRKKYDKRNTTARVGDRVKILKGKFKGKIGKIQRRDLSNYKIFIKGAEVEKKDGTSFPFPIDPSNVKILEVDMEDKRRKKRLEAKK